MRALAFLVLFLIGLTPAAANAQKAVSADALSAIYNSPAPAFGDPNGIPVVEFCDYQSNFCQASEEGLQRLLQEGGIKLIIMDFPQLGAMSTTAAEATLAALRQGPEKYYAMRAFLMSKDVRVNDDTLAQAAQQAGVNIDQMQQDMTDPVITQQIQDNIAIARSVGVGVTPSFIVGGYFFPGFADYDQLKKDVDYVRTNGGR